MIALITVRPSLADSDGYYCTGPNYLAYELRSAITPGVSGTHVLRVVRFEEDAGIVFSGEVDLEDFQPHKLYCGEREVRIGGWSWRPVEYLIDVSGDSGPRIIAQSSEPGRVMQGRTALQNLGGWAKSGVKALPFRDQKSQYRLSMTETEERRGGSILRHKTTVLLRVDGDGNVMQRMELYAGSLEESID